MLRGISSGDNGELTFLDIISIISFCVGLENLELNITEQDLNTQTQELDKRLKIVIDDIHTHQQEQDNKLDKIMEVLNNGSSRDLQ